MRPMNSYRKSRALCLSKYAGQRNVLPERMLMTFTTRAQTFTIVIDKCVKLGRATNSMGVPEWVVSPNWPNVSTWLILPPDRRTYLAILCGFIFAMESYLEHRGRDCHAGRYRFMNNSSRNCLCQCAYSIPNLGNYTPCVLKYTCALHESRSSVRR